jgi:hypothetical protein
MTAAQYAKRILKRDKDLKTALTFTTKAIGASAFKLSKEEMSKLYAIPEDLNAKGKKKWRRTGHLRRSESVEVRGPIEVAIVNTAAYAEPRHEAGKPGRRNINPQRENHWQDEMAKVMRPIAVEQWRETVVDVLKGNARRGVG